MNTKLPYISVMSVVTLLSFMILFIHTLFFSRLAKGLSHLFIFFKEPALGSIDLFYYLFVSAVILTVSFLIFEFCLFFFF